MNPFRIDPQTLDFVLPDDRIAQEPAKERDQARLLVVHRATGEIDHKKFSDLVDYLNAGDVLVLNKAKVSKAKLTGKKDSGGKVEVIFLERINGNGEWKALVRPLVKDGTSFTVGNSLNLSVKRRFSSGEYVLEVKGGDVEQVLSAEGRLPLPPYIKRSMGDPRIQMDEREYQTIYAACEGSVAAPTAGLHFSEQLLTKLKAKGIQVVEILLHVGWGTFKPIIDSVDSHKMLGEKYEIDSQSIKTLLRAKKEGRRLVAVGTTSTRTLESLNIESLSPEAPLEGSTDIFIKPGFSFKWVDALITNLHVPRSTPVSLTAAFCGLENIEKSYAAAIDQKYRFYSYGDAMLIV